MNQTSPAQQSLRHRVSLHIVDWSFIPVALWVAVFICVPLFMVSSLAFMTKGPYGTIRWVFTIDNFTRLLDPIYGEVLWQSFIMALSASLGTAFLGLPYALALLRAPKPILAVLFTALLLPFLANFVVRIYGLRLLLHEGSWINLILQHLSFQNNPLPINDTPWAVWLGMMANYLPYMVLPLYVGLRHIDWRVVEAAKDLGANYRVILSKILLPQLIPHLLSGMILVFVPALGEYMIPDLLGGAKNALLGNVITDQFLKLRHWPFGAALTSVLNVCLILLLIIHRRSQRETSRPKVVGP